MSHKFKYPVIILAGGFGTRLQKVVADKPKPMASVNGKPFVEYLLESLERSGVVSRIILSVGYLHEQIVSYFGSSFGSIPIEYSIEETPLGTGGAVVKAAMNICDNNFFLVNGDTMFMVDLNSLVSEHKFRNADLTMALKRMYNFDRYGTVGCTDGVIKQFVEKHAVDEGLINGGVYLVRRSSLLSYGFPEVFSFEKDFLQAYFRVLRIYGVIFDDYFIDIGIPEDFARAQEELPRLHCR